MTDVALRRLEVDHQPWPAVIDSARPRFSWVIDHRGRAVRQRSHRVVVEAADGRRLWDSGEVASDETVCTPGEPIECDDLSDCTWRVTARLLIDGRQQTVSADSSFETGAISRHAWDGSAWVSGSGGPDAAAPLLRTGFRLPATVTRARLLVACGGFASVTLNGVAVTTEVLSPGSTDYEDRVPYTVHDVTGSTRAADNVLAAALGRAFYGLTTENTWNWHRAPWHAEPTLRALLVVDHDQGQLRLGTGGGTRTARGGTRADSLYEGEHFDARLEPEGWREVGFDARHWAPATLVEGPRGALRVRPFPGIRVTDEVSPRSIERLADASFVVDFGRQIAGWTRLRTPASMDAGDEIVVTLAERLVDGIPEIATPFSAGDLQVDHYVSAGGEATWEPSFGYKGFQYARVHGWPEPELDPDGFVARVAHTDLERRARFACSDELLTWMHEASVATMLNNLHHIPTDTPVFEKNGWTGDAQLAADMMLRDLDSQALLEDWVRSIAESRDADGRPALIAPSPDWVWPEHMAAPPWHAAYVMIPWQIYLTSGDPRVLEEHAQGIYDYLRLEHRVAVNGLSQTGLGDYLSPDRSGNPDEDLRVCATASVYESTMGGVRIARLLSDHAIEREFIAAAALIRRSFIDEFFDPQAGVVRDAVAGYRQTHNVLALDAHLLPPASERGVADALARDVRVNRGGHLWVGALGVRRALQALDRFGHGAVAFAAATTRDFPSWGRWFEQGATTMWEYWDDQRSRDHYFFGTVDDWLFSDVAGIDLAAPGYRRITVAPQHLTRLDAASAEIETARGRLAVAWERDGSRGVLRLELPVGSVADVRLPGIRRQSDSAFAEFAFAVDAADRAVPA